VRFRASNDLPKVNLTDSRVFRGTADSDPFRFMRFRRSFFADRCNGTQSAAERFDVFKSYRQRTYENTGAKRAISNWIRMIVTTKAAQAAALGNPTLEQLKNRLMPGTQFLLNRVGCVKPGEADEVIESVYAGIDITSPFDDHEIDKIILGEVRKRTKFVSVDRSLVCRDHADGRAVEFLRGTVRGWPKGQLEAFRSYYHGGLSREAACEKHDISLATFSMAQTFLRGRVVKMMQT
jgi:hypothetical protein